MVASPMHARVSKTAAASNADRLVWLGASLKPEVILSRFAVSPAAQRWQRGLLTGLRRIVPDLHVVGHCPDRTWPYGQLWPGSIAELEDAFRQTLVPYANLRGLRSSSLARNYARALSKVKASSSGRAVVVSYNADEHVRVAVRRAFGTQVPWVPVVLDYNLVGNEWTGTESLLRGTAGAVYLSWWAHSRHTGSPSLHLDGGVVEASKGFPIHPTAKPRLLYTGALDQWGGITQLLDAFTRLRAPNATLVVTGWSQRSAIRKRLETTPGVEYRGRVDEATLLQLAEQASVLVNPRPLNIPGNQMNFPSKLLEYLTYGRPVVTTMTPGVAPEYADFTIPAKSDSPDDLAAAIDRALSLDHVHRVDMARRVEHFLSTSRLWTIQAAKLWDFLRLEVAPAS
jgi:glycosyltransferase involved in cell wall biosynthesis